MAEQPNVIQKPMGMFPMPMELAFLQWYRAWATLMGLNPNPDDPRHFYDYRRAFLSHVEPSIDAPSKQWHWPSQFKLPGHPRTILEGIDTRTGQPVKP